VVALLLVGLSAALLFAARSWRQALLLEENRQATISALREGRFNDAIQSGRWWADRQPDSVAPLQALLEAGMKSGRLPVAIGAGQALLARGATQPELRERLALWLFLTGNLEQADEQCRLARKANPGREHLALLHADILQRLGETAKASDLLDQLSQAGGKSPPILTLKGVLLLEEGETAKAVTLLREAMSLSNPPAEKTLHYLALALTRAGDTEAANAVFAQLRSRQDLEIWEKYGRSDSTAYKISLAEALIQMGKREEALQLLSQARQEFPDNPFISRLIATALQQPVGGR
jgi:tetratricopeptide (TPR) repeat protein